MSSSRREVIHLSIGSEACQVAAHLCNLQGLAGTSEACDAQVTQSVYQKYHVPRILLVDRPQAFVQQQRRLLQDSTSFVWSGGAVEQLEQPSVTEAPTKAGEALDPFDQFWQDASALAYAPYSRYRTNETESAYQTSSDGRHVVWDDDEPEIDEEEEERLRQRQIKQEQEWYQSTCRPLQQNMDEFWNTQVSTDMADAEREPEAATSTGTSDDATRTTTTNDRIPWTEFFMPPYHPKSCLPLPHDSSADNVWDTFTNGQAGISTTWKEDELLERLRNILEDCDACQGIVLLSSASATDGWAAGLTSALLEELQDECPAANRFVIPIQGQTDIVDNWHTRNVYRVRGQVEQGLALHQYRELAHAMLPLQIPQDSSWKSAAWLALGLEAATLPYRLNPSNKSLIGINSSHFYGSSSHDLNFGTAPHLTFREFLNQLRPSSAHCVLEMDLMTKQGETSLETLLKAGTSVEHDPRVKRPRRATSRQELPGQWLLPQGIMNCMSPVATDTSGGFMDRSLHRHFALSTALRPHVRDLSITQYLTCLMEGTGPRFRPEQSTSTVLQQGILSDLTAGGYGAGSYWKHIWKTDVPVLSVLGNTTRSYGALNQTCKGMKEALRSSHLRGFYNRDVQQGALPEVEDCEEALASCWDLRDVYMPPDGSGLV